MNLPACLVLVALSWHLFGVAAVGAWQSSRMTAKRFQFVCGLVFGCVKGSFAMWLALENHTAGGIPRDKTLGGRMWSDLSFWVCIPIPLAWTIALAYSEQPKPTPSAASRTTTVLTSISYGCLLLIPGFTTTTTLRLLSDAASIDLVVLGILMFCVSIIGVYFYYAIYQLMKVHGGGWRGFVNQFRGVSIFAVAFGGGVGVSGVFLIACGVAGWSNEIVHIVAHISCVAGTTVALVIELRVTMHSVLVDAVAVVGRENSSKYHSVDIKTPTLNDVIHASPRIVGSMLSPPSVPMTAFQPQPTDVIHPIDEQPTGAEEGKHPTDAAGQLPGLILPPSSEKSGGRAQAQFWSTPRLASDPMRPALPDILNAAPAGIAISTVQHARASVGTPDSVLRMEVEEARLQSWSGDACFVRCVELRLTLKQIVLLFVLGVAASITGYFLITTDSLNHDKKTFDSLCSQLSGSMEDQLRLLVNGPLGLSSLVSAVTPTGAMSVTVYVAYESHSNDLIIGSTNAFSRLLRNETERAQWESRIGVNISSVDPKTGALLPLSPNAGSMYLPIEFTDLPAYTGWDLFTYPVISRTARDVIWTGQVLSSPPVPLPTGLGWIVCAPVFRNYSLGRALTTEWDMTTRAGENVTSIEACLFDEILGVAFAPINAPGLIARVNTPVRMTLFDESDPTPLAVETVDFDVSTSYTLSKYFAFGGRMYEVQCDVGREFMEYHIAPKILLATLMLVSVVLSALLWGTVLARRRLILRYAEIRDAHAAKQSAINMSNQARKDADEANHSKSQFMNYLCHELRNPLHVILSMLDLIYESPGYAALSKDDLLSYRTVRSSSMVMFTLLNDVLDMSKIEAGKMNVEPRSFDIRKLIDTLISETRPANNKPELVSSADPSVPVWIVSDPLRIRQILVNLIQNAIKFTTVGYVRVNVSTYDIMPPAANDLNSTAVTVLTSPVAPAAPAIPGVVPFRKTPSGGMKMIQISVEDTGSVSVRSRLGHGTTFSVQLLLEIGNPTISPPPLPPILVAATGRDEKSITQPSSTDVTTGTAGTGTGLLPATNPLVALALARAGGDAGMQPQPVESVQRQSIAGIWSLNQPHTISLAVTPPGVVSVAAAAMIPAVAMTAPSASASTFALSIKTVSNPSSIRVLIVDDSEINLRILSTIVNRPGYDVVLARNGFEAIEAVLSAASRLMKAESGIATADNGMATPPDLHKAPKLLPFVDRAFDIIFMDIAMPIMDGAEATRQLRTLWNCHIPIVAVTANALVSDREKCVTAGATEFLPKPFRREHIHAVLSKFHLFKQ